MTTTTPQGTTLAVAAPRLAALRGNCMAAAVLLIVQFGLGVGLNLYVTLPAHKSPGSTVLGSPLLTVHIIVAVTLLGTAIGALIRAIRARRAVAFASVGLSAIMVAASAGASFVGNQSNGASLGMALAAVTAIFCYLAAIFRLR